MTTLPKAIRSTGWKTDFLIGFPDGLFVLFFCTQAMQRMNLSVQTFYTIHLSIWLGGALLVMIAVYLANRGDKQDESLLTPRERHKLQQLDISTGMITQIESEMAKDARLWEDILVQQQVATSTFRLAQALRSAIVSGIFFLFGGILALGPFLANENFNAASRTSMLVAFLALTCFSFLKAKMTTQRTWVVIFRYFLMAAGVLAGSWLVAKLF
ncbi:VIT1/CCC1 transporter family protein [Chitinophaga defluvii]|uniref:VIT1/CCC1 transporter family protein n=1 Tax=Chitinophaga defluvii TaxID=3163343 RepID=A0ABV2T2Q2_9BACT